MRISSYIYGTSFYHHYDVRAKLIFTLSVAVAIFFVQSLLGLFLAALALALISILSVGLKESGRSLLRIAPIIAFLILFLPLQDRSGTPIWTINNFTVVTKDGLLAVYRAAMKFITLSYVFFLLIETERTENLIKGLRWFKIPYSVALMLSLVLRFIPYLGGLYSEIRSSMSLRLREGKRGYPILPTITALTVASVRMIPDTAATLEERGFGRRERRDYNFLGYKRLLFTEIIVSAIVPIIFVLLFRRY